MSDKPTSKLNALDVLIRQTSRCGMTQGTVMVIEFISGFELFNTREYHNYETWSQGWRVHGLGICVEREDLDDAVAEWSIGVARLRAGEAVPRHLMLANRRRDKDPYRAGEVLPDWINPKVSA